MITKNVHVYWLVQNIKIKYINVGHTYLTMIKTLY